MKKKKQYFVVDNTVLKDMFEGSIKGKEMLKKFEDTKDNIKVLTTTSSFIKAVKDALFIKTINLGRLMVIMEVHVDDADYRNRKAIQESIVHLAKQTEGI